MQRLRFDDFDVTDGGSPFTSTKRAENCGIIIMFLYQRLFWRIRKIPFRRRQNRRSDRACMFYDGRDLFPTEVTVNDNESYPIESITLPAPCFEGAERYSIQQGAGMVVTKSDAKTEYAAAEFFEMVYRCAAQPRFYGRLGISAGKKSANDTELVKKKRL